MTKRALFIVDPQLDFMPGGSLAVPFGDKIIDTVNKLISSGRFDVVIISRDWHPFNHKSFTTENPGTNVLDVVKINGKDMIMWPPHCVQFTDGAKFHPDLMLLGVPIFTKGDNIEEHPFSGFSAINDDGISVELFFKANDIEEVYVVGLAGDYCVKETAIDCSVFFKTYFIVDATRFIGDMTQTLENLAKDGIIIVNSKDCFEYYLKEDKYYTRSEVKSDGIPKELFFKD
jgi:nicotinamidase/pyrazinamidase